MIPNLSDLQKQVKALGLDVQRSGKREAKEDYLKVLRVYHLNQDHPNGLPYDEILPMLCFDYNTLHPKEQKTLWTNHDWITQKKLNGCRMILHFVEKSGVFAHSRAISASTFRRTQYQDRLLFRDFVPSFSATIDAEVLCDRFIDTRPFTKKGEVTKSTLQSTTALLQLEPEASRRLQQEQNAPLVFHTFDILNWLGNDLKEKRLCERAVNLEEFKAEIKKTDAGKYFEFVPNCIRDKKAFYEQVLKAGGEGIIFKNLNSKYEASTSRNRYGWVKLKRQLELDGYCSGFEQGRPSSELSNHVATLLFSVVTEKGPRLIAKVSNIPWELRKNISIYDRLNGKVSMSVEVYGRCARIIGTEFSQRAFRLVNPRISHWRTDLKQEQCVYALEDLLKVRMGDSVIPMRVIK